MPVGFSFKKSGAHRLACRSLYKRLLTACKQFQSPSTPRSLPSHLQSLVRYRYHHDRNLQSPQRVQDALAFGREALQLVEAASTGSPQALTAMTQVLTGTVHRAELTARVKEHLKKDFGNFTKKQILRQEFLRAAADPATKVRKPDSIPILERPVPLSEIKGGRRYVPRYVAAQGMSFLRYGKKQPWSLSLFIQGKRNQIRRRWEVVAETEKMAQMGRLEDEWDQQMRAELGLTDGDASRGKEPSWAVVYDETHRESVQKAYADMDALTARGERLWEISLKEKALAEEEKQAVRDIKRREKTAGSNVSEGMETGSFLGE